MLDPEIWTNEGFGNLSPLAQVYCIGIISNADDEGRIKASAKYLKALVRPYGTEGYDTVTIALTEVYDSGIVVHYIVKEVEYAYLPNWSKFQYIQKPRESHLPPVTDGYVTPIVGVSPNRIELNRIEVQDHEPPVPPLADESNNGGSQGVGGSGSVSEETFKVVKFVERMTGRTGVPRRPQLLVLEGIRERKGLEWVEGVLEGASEAIAGAGGRWSYVLKVLQNAVADGSEPKGLSCPSCGRGGEKGVVDGEGVQEWHCRNAECEYDVFVDVSQ